MSKANVEISLRRLAGYHICPGDKSALEYSRNAAAPVLRQIEAIFISVRANLFRPDMLRSSLITQCQTCQLFNLMRLSVVKSSLSLFRTLLPDDTTLWDLREHTLNKPKTASAILLDEAVMNNSHPNLQMLRTPGQRTWNAESCWMAKRTPQI